MTPKLIDDLKINSNISSFLVQNCYEKGVGVSISKEIIDDSICIIKIDDYYNSLNIADTPPSVDCLIIQHCKYQNFYFHLIELRSTDITSRLDIYQVIEKFKTTIYDFISVRFFEPIGKYDSATLKLILVSKVTNIGSDTMLRKILKENSFIYKEVISIIDLRVGCYEIQKC
jgi:hypothetical protein